MGRKILAQMNDSEEGKSIIQLRPRINQASVDFQFLRSLPTNTFGFAYVNMMDKHGYTPEDRDEVRYIPANEVELAHVLQRYREVYDFWHILTGLPTTVEGEVIQKWFEWEITRLPLCFVSATLGAARLTYTQQQDLLKYGIPWSMAASKAIRKPLMCKWYENYFEYDLNHLREELGIITFENYMKQEKY